MCAEYIVKNITEQKPDLVIFGGDNISGGFTKKRATEFIRSLIVHYFHDNNIIVSFSKKVSIP